MTIFFKHQHPPNALSPICKTFSDKVISDNTIDIYEKINVSELVIELSKRNCTVNDYQEKGESLENYYLNLIGGASND